MQVVNGRRTVHYEIRGSGHRPVVLLPALGTSGAMWGPQFGSFPEYTLIPVETAGHFATGAGQVELRDYADDTRAVLDAVGLQRALVVGISMGGMIAQEMALHFPDRVAALVLVSTTSGYAESARVQMRQRAATVESGGMEAIVDATLQRWFTARFRAEHSDAVELIRSDLLKADPRAYAAAACAVSNVDTTGRLQEIDVPALVVRGELDPSISAEAASTLSSRIPGAGEVTLDAAAHLLTYEAAERFNTLARDFFDSLPRSAGDDDTSLMSPW